MLYSEFAALCDAARHTDVELTYKNRFTGLEFTIKSTPAINGNGWLWVIRTECEDSMRDILETLDVVFYHPAPEKFLFLH